ncbi:MAG: hypothetical protein DRN96_00110 [Thermoproteota archaeon]|nr:MAG: hypothetical protein DRN96_00110 [Candidatus Korarchaeota archaeon]RLG54920.1 MAG: hypothetical protein DRN99_04235 [Candidatus Korarchaeota archaeon]
MPSLDPRRQLIREILKALKATTKSPVIEKGSMQLSVPMLVDTGVARDRGEFIEVDRPRALLEYLRAGGTYWEVAHLVTWRDFEQFTSLALEAFGYSVIRDYRFKFRGKRHQIDVIGFKPGTVVCFECKMLRKRMSSVARAAKLHADRVRKLCLAKPSWLPSSSRVYPVIVTVLEYREKAVDGVPVVPFYMLNSFLMDIEYAPIPGAVFFTT